MDDNIFLKKFRELDDSVLPSNELPIDGRDDELTAARDLLSKSRLKAKKDAKNLIEACAKLFISSGQMSEDEYVKYKKKVDTMSLSNTLYQLHTAHIAIDKLCESIYTGNASSKYYENLSYLQRIVLDINKFLGQYMSDMETSYRELKDKIDEIMIERSIEGDEDQNMGGKNVLISTRNRSALLAELNAISEEYNAISKIPSMNAKLLKDGDDIDQMGSVDRMMGETSEDDVDSADDSDDIYDDLDSY